MPSDKSEGEVDKPLPRRRPCNQEGFDDVPFDALEPEQLRRKFFDLDAMDQDPSIMM